MTTIRAQLPRVARRRPRIYGRASDESGGSDGAPVFIGPRGGLSFAPAGAWVRARGQILGASLGPHGGPFISFCPFARPTVGRSASSRCRIHDCRRNSGSKRILSVQKPPLSARQLAETPPLGAETTTVGATRPPSAGLRRSPRPSLANPKKRSPSHPRPHRWRGSSPARAGSCRADACARGRARRRTSPR